MLEVRLDSAKLDKNHPIAYRKDYSEKETEAIGKILQQIRDYCEEKLPSLKTSLRVYFYDGVYDRAYIEINIDSWMAFGYYGGHGNDDRNSQQIPLRNSNSRFMAEFGLALIDNWDDIKIAINSEISATTNLYYKITNFKI